MHTPRGHLTRILARAHAGDEAAGQQLWSSVYDELCRIAHRARYGGRGGETMSTTALVHEAYLKLVDGDRVPPESQTHFFALSCRAMRQILVDNARRKHAAKRGGDARHISLDDALVVADEEAEEMVALDVALTRLAALHPRLAQVVECRYFGGLTAEETAQVMGTSSRTVERDWVRAKVYLHGFLRDEAAGETG